MIIGITAEDPIVGAFKLSTMRYFLPVSEIRWYRSLFRLLMTY